MRGSTDYFERVLEAEGQIPDYQKGISIFSCAFTNISKPLLIVAGTLLGLLVWKGVRVDENVV